MRKFFDKYMILLLLVTIVWGSTFVVIKGIIAETNEYFLVFARCLIAAIPMVLYLLIKDRKSLLHFPSFYRGMILGLLLGIIYSSQVIGLQFTTTGHSAFITGIAVILVPLFLFLFWKQNFSKFEVIAILIVFFGVFLLTFTPGEEINLGDLITLVTAFTCAFHFILAGKFVVKSETLALITYQFLGATIVTLIAFVIFDNNWNSLSENAIYSLIYLGLFGTLFCYFVYVWAQKFVSPMFIVLTFSLEPIFASLFGYWFLSELMDLKEIAGAAFIVSGIIFYKYKQHRLKNA
ncbi:MAG: DMT family transporter [Rhodothermaceae bacterium]